MREHMAGRQSPPGHVLQEERTRASMIFEAFGTWRPRAVVFDCDGLLMDTEELWIDVQEAVCDRFGVQFDGQLRHSLVGLPASRVGPLIASLARTSSDAVVEALLDLNIAMVRDRARPLPGARNLVRAVNAKVPSAVASNSARKVLEATLARGGFRDFHAVLSADEVPRPKPSPDIYLAAAEALGQRPEQCLALEDSENGARAARAAGLRVVAVPSVRGQLPSGDLVLDTLESPALLEWVASWS